MGRKLTTEEWISKAKSVHGERYDYSKSIYLNSKKKVIIICKEHGEFPQTPVEHNRGSGCKQCGLISMRKNTLLTTDEWIKKAKEIHGNKYDYSETIYTRIGEKLNIRCSIHGSYSQLPQNHTQGSGCPRCGEIERKYSMIESWKKRRKTNETFIKEAKQIHGARFDYSSTKYSGYGNKIDLECPIHGLVSTYPHIHIQGNGCPKCGKIDAGRSRALTTEAWINRAKKKHGKKFDYSNSTYINSNTKLNIICPKHGGFSQHPMVHLGSHGCPDCGSEIGAQSNRISLDDFVKSAIGVHGYTYDYSLVEYVNNRTEITIGCAIHGFFKGRPDTHVRRGHGCPKCAGRGLTRDDWIERFKQIHRTRYDYTDFEYNGATNKSSIICKIHGDFQQTPSSHYNTGNGCPECAIIENTSKRAKMGLDNFIKRGRGKFGDKFDYSKVIYKNNRTPVEISCEDHGPFNQSPTVHIKSATGCSACTREIPRGVPGKATRSRKGGYTTESWIAKATKVHDGFYDYSKVVYGKSSDLLTIICPKHGDYLQLATNHVKGIGCWNCYKDRASKLQRMTKEEVIEKCKNIHGDYYDYSKVEYINNKSKFILVCPIHGDFETNFSLHYHQKCGCSGCAKHGYDIFAPGYYYVHHILNEFGDVIFIKGGISNDPVARFKRWKTAIKSLPRHKNHLPIVVHKAWFENGEEALDLEKALLDVEHIRYPAVPGMDGGTELFRTDPLIYAIEEWGLDLDLQ
jgi:hypothetical protein